MTKLHTLIPLALCYSQLVGAAGELPAAYGPPQGSNPLTWGFYATHEVRDPVQLEVEGHFPTWVTGSLYRGAAGTWDVGNYTAEHWFDGFSRNHRFEIANGQVSYRSRNGTDEMMEHVRELGVVNTGQFGADPCKIIFGAFETIYRDGNHTRGDESSNNVDVAFIPNVPGLAPNTTSTGAPFKNLVMATDGNALQQLDPVTMEPIELFNYQVYNPLLVAGGRSAAHPVQGFDGAVYNYVLDTNARPPVYRVFGLTQPAGQATILANITDAPPAYIHSLFGTPKHLVLIVWQADLTQQAKTILGAIGPWNPKRNALFYVIDRVNGGVLGKYVAPDTFFAFHEINSFEDPLSGDVLIDLPKMNDTGFLTAAKIENLRANVGAANGSSKNDLIGAFTRYRLPAHTGPVRHDNGSLVALPASIDFQLPWAAANLELPRINPELVGKPYRFAYGIHAAKPGSFADSIIKIDTLSKSWKVWTPSVPHMPSEPIFVARPNATCEDDGVLLTVAMDAREKKSALIALDARTLEELGRARMPVVMGYGFHGAWGGYN